MRGRVLIVAGSDSGGGAGIQADIKTATALGAYAATAITALTAQDTTGVHGIHAVPAEFVARQMRVVLADIGADYIKTGMLHDAAIITAVADVIEREGAGIPLVVDPVIVAKGGAALLDPAASQALKARLILRADVITPNVPEAEFLTGMTIATLADMRDVAAMLLTLGPRAVLLKGGHLRGDKVRDVLATEDGMVVFRAPRIDTRDTHGTGCTLASAIAVGLAQGLGLRDAVRRARRYVRRAIRTAPGLGRGHGPLNHAHTVRRFDGRGQSCKPEP
ncbi:MAG: bifunctional hydroxymethylpyrimidine kinase/phosphomethylpyrimidine kinase [Alphaproteobacteria bacterium]|nr:bifunctional hydroxymethylpyrimidine kinase/phosphomethylpyrimidine kinase [Alphaproteobacteria bacterium]